MKSSKVLGGLISVVQLASMVVFVLTMQTILGVFATSLPNGETEIEPQLGDPVVIPFPLNPSNNGYLDATLTVSVSLMVDGGQEIASDSETVNIPPGSSVPVELELSLSQAEAIECLQEGAEVEWLVDFKVTTLYDLISFSNTMTMSGGD